MQREKREQRFWSRVKKGAKDECWEWQGPTQKTFGYGWTWFDGSARNTHRVAWILTHGPIAAGLCVCHRCDNPKCCNPAHLFLGTKGENTLDMVAKGRNYRPPPLCAEKQARIRELRTKGITYREIAKVVGCSVRTAHQYGSTEQGFIRRGAA